jgi:hypothetical protein
MAKATSANENVIVYMNYSLNEVVPAAAISDSEL